MSNVSAKQILASHASVADDASKTVSDRVETIYVIRASDGRPITTRFTKYAAKERARTIEGATIEKMRLVSEKARQGVQHGA